MTGIALEGGGAKGSYQVGVMLALIDNGIKPDMVAGTSIGAVNAALLCQGDRKKMINLWTETTTDLFGIDSLLVDKIKTKEFKFNDFFSVYENLKQIFTNKGIDTDHILDVINDNIDEEKVRNSKIKFGLVTLKLKGLEPLELTIDDIPEGKLSEYILASCYLPVFSFKKIIDDNFYLDGGFYNNLPITLLEKEGCNKIYSVRVKGVGRIKKQSNIDTEIIEIKPRKGLGSMLIFDKDSNTKHMRIGYLDALRVIKNLDGTKYYFKNKKESYYTRIISKQNKETLNKLRLRFKHKDDKELVIKIIEHLMKKYDFEELKIYNVKKVIKRLKKLVTNKLYKDFIYNARLFL